MSETGDGRGDRRRITKGLTAVTCCAMLAAGPAPDQSSEQRLSQVQHEMGLLPKDLTKEPFQFGDRVEVATGTVDDGAVFVSGQLLYAYQARSTAPFFTKDSWGTMNFPAGLNFYGVPLGNPFGNGLHGLAWCSPDSSKKLIFASCIVALDGKAVTGATVRYNPYLARGLTVNLRGGGDSRIAIEQVEPGQDLFAGVATVELRVSGWAGSRLQIVTNVLANGMVVSSLKQKLRLKNGVATLGFGGGIVRLRPTNGRGSIELVSPIKRSDSVVGNDLS